MADAFCIRCKRVSNVLVLGDWHPPWALCPDPNPPMFVVWCA